jgi:hypothetical protein
VTLVRSWRKLLPDLEEDDLQGFPNKKISKSEIPDMACAMRSFENIKEEAENGYRVMSVKWASSTRQTDRHCQWCRKQMGEEGGAN